MGNPCCSCKLYCTCETRSLGASAREVRTCRGRSRDTRFVACPRHKVRPRDGERAWPPPPRLVLTMQPHAQPAAPRPPACAFAAPLAPCACCRGTWAPRVVVVGSRELLDFDEPFIFIHDNAHQRTVPLLWSPARRSCADKKMINPVYFTCMPSL